MNEVTDKGILLNKVNYLKYCWHNMKPQMIGLVVEKRKRRRIDWKRKIQNDISREVIRKWIINLTSLKGNLAKNNDVKWEYFNVDRLERKIKSWE